MAGKDDLVRHFAIILTYENGQHRAFQVEAETSGDAIQKLLANLTARESISGTGGHARFIHSVECSEILYPPEDIIK